MYAIVDGCSDLARTDLFHAGTRRALQELCPVKPSAQTYEIAAIDILILFLRIATKKFVNSWLLL